ncbi:hypothetical protein C8J57DRAFT_1723480 [Mycena rebaudengoi]|nr:hypothetical protein C8J57DRAFT_1723480 [Mycena rebaudengoi]
MSTTITTEVSCRRGFPANSFDLLGQRAALLKAISAIDTRRNSLVPASKLSPELLSEVFLILASYSRIPADDPSYMSPVEVRQSTRAVCHYWRNVAVACAALWSYIDFSWDLLERVEEALKRSMITPLVVQASLRNLPALGNVKLALKHISRIQCLDLGFDALQFSAFEDLLQPAPALHVLRLSCEHSPVRLSPTIFVNEPRNLRELELTGCILTPDSHLLRNLTYLSVTAVPLDSAFSVFQWLSILESLPLLQVLSLIQCFSAPEEPPNTLPLVQLHELFSLALDTNTQNCSSMLTQLVFPPTPCLEIICHTEEFPADVGIFSEFVAAIAPKIKNISPTHKMLSLGISWRDGLQFRASLDEKANVAPNTRDSEFYLAFLPEAPSFSLAQAILDVFPTSNVLSLDLGTPLCICPLPSHWVFGSEETWRALLLRFPAVHTLNRIQYDWASIILSLLVPPGDRIASTTTPKVVLLPALHTLAFVNTAFDIPAIIPSLMKLLKWRTDNGKCIKTISATFCKNVLSKLQMLSDAGVYVKWDRNNHFEGEQEEGALGPRTRRMRGD